MPRSFKNKRAAGKTAAMHKGRSFKRAMNTARVNIKSVANQVACFFSMAVAPRCETFLIRLMWILSVILTAVGHAFTAVFAPIGRRIYPIFDLLILKNLRAIRDEFRRVGQGFGIAAARLKEAAGAGVLAVAGTFAKISVKAVWRHRKIVTTAFNYSIPIITVLLILPVMTAWSSASYALLVRYNGQELGYVTQESVFTDAITQAQDSIVNVVDGFALNQIPELSLEKLGEEDTIIEAAELRNKIIAASGDVIEQADGLYVDDEFMGAVKNKKQIAEFLDGMLAKYSTGAEGERVEFLKDIRFEEGLYPKATLVPESTVLSRLDATVAEQQVYTIAVGDTPVRIAKQHGITLEQLNALNPDINKRMYAGNEVIISAEQPWLGVQIIRTETAIEQIPYERETTENSKKTMGTRTVLTKGEEGEQKVGYQITYVNGIESRREVVSTELVKAPVTEVVEVGTKPYTITVQTNGKPVTVSPSKYSTGTFSWPVGGGRISSRYGPRWGTLHDGIDIAAPSGTPIYASDGGVVTQAGWRAGGYGYCVFIDHGNGYVTQYCHCSAVYVSVGQAVTKGQKIAAVGQTGYAFGNHLHFVVKQNGRSVNPAPYLGV